MSVLAFAQVFDPGAVFDSVDLGSSPTWEDALFATRDASGAMIGIEAASGPGGRGARRAARA